MISGMSSNRLTKLEGSSVEAFFVQAVINLLKDTEEEGGGGGSPPPWLGMVAKSTNPRSVLLPVRAFFRISYT